MNRRRYPAKVKPGYAAALAALFGNYSPGNSLDDDLRTQLQQAVAAGDREAARQLTAELLGVRQ